MTVAAKDKRENASSQRAVEAISRIETLIKSIQKGTLEEVIKSCLAFRDQTEVVSARDVKGRGCLHLIAQRRDVAAVDICKHLVGNVKCDVEMRDADGATALLIAMSRANALVLEYLLVDGKADALVTSKDERNAWHFLAEWDGGREQARETAERERLKAEEDKDGQMKTDVKSDIDAALDEVAARPEATQPERAGESTRTLLISPGKLALPFPRPARGASLAPSLAG